MEISLLETYGTMMQDMTRMAVLFIFCVTLAAVCMGIIIFKNKRDIERR